MLESDPIRPRPAARPADPVVIGLGRVLLGIGILTAAGLALVLWAVLR